MWFWENDLKIKSWPDHRGHECTVKDLKNIQVLWIQNSSSFLLLNQEFFFPPLFTGMLKTSLGVVISWKILGESAFKSWKYDFHPVWLLVDWEVFLKNMSHCGNFCLAALWEHWGEREAFPWIHRQGWAALGGAGPAEVPKALLLEYGHWNPHFYGIWKQINHSSGILMQPEVGSPRKCLFFG